MTPEQTTTRVQKLLHSAGLLAPDAAAPEHWNAVLSRLESTGPQCIAKARLAA